jgi:ABC-type multidrug transport system fused ATPase/permease subunit
VVISLFRAFLRPYARQAWIVVALLAAQSAGNLYLPSLTGDIINNGVVTGNTGYIWRTGGLMIGIAVAMGIAGVAVVSGGARVSMAVGADMRAAVFRRVQAFSARELSRFGIPSLITRNVNDVQQVQLFLQMALTLLITACLSTVGGVVMAVREGATLSLLLVVAVPVLTVVIGAMVFAVVPVFRSVQARIDRINQVLREQVTGVRVIRAFGRTVAEHARFSRANADLTRVALRGNRIFTVIGPVLLLVLSLSSVSAIWFGSRFVGNGSMPIGNLIAFLTYILLILFNVLVTVVIIAQAPRAMASAERIDEVIRTVPASTDPPHPVSPDRITGAVEFRHVSFGYPGTERPVISDLTFVLRPGSHSAIIGGTGSGKTTLLHLIARFLVATSGAVLVNETDVREQAAEQLWSAIGLVPQETFLFRGTVASNLRFASPDATDEQLWHALDMAQALDFVASMPGQLDAPIDQGGSNVSGGQRQRLCIARALVRRPRLYLFDDCFSALDAPTASRLRRALRAEAADATVVTAAQQVAAIREADQIIVLDGGRVAGIGTHHELLGGCPVYQEIAASQLTEGAVA